jgi:hypothetical protein
MWMPDNPEAKSQRRYRYDRKLDALDYGWKLANEILDVTHFLVSAFPAKAKGK